MSTDLEKDPVISADSDHIHSDTSSSSSFPPLPAACSVHPSVPFRFPAAGEQRRTVDTDTRMLAHGLTGGHAPPHTPASQHPASLLAKQPLSSVCAAAAARSRRNQQPYPVSDDDHLLFPAVSMIANGEASSSSRNHVKRRKLLAGRMVGRGGCHLNACVAARSPLGVPHGGALGATKMRFRPPAAAGI